MESENETASIRQHTSLPTTTQSASKADKPRPIRTTQAGFMPPPMPRQPSCTHSKQTATAQQNTARGESALYTDSIILSHAAGAELSPELQEAKEAGKGRPFLTFQQRKQHLDRVREDRGIFPPSVVLHQQQAHTHTHKHAHMHLQQEQVKIKCVLADSQG